MREIKFRGKSIIKFPQNNDEVLIYSIGEWIKGGIVFDEDRYWIDTQYFGQIAVNPETIGQYTGLKDKNGVEIYEGDIVKYNEFWEGDCHYNAGCGEVLWDDEETGFYLSAKDTSFLNLFDLTRNLDAEVIGNIYDNPELLEEE